MGAMHFLSSSVGVGVTAAEFPCYVQVRSGGVEVARQSQKVRLAISRNGGRHWLIVGGTLPVTPAATGAGGEQVVATSVRDVWALSSNGHVLVTSNGGGAWIVAPLPRPVVQLAVADRAVWALACPHTVRHLCRPVLDRTGSPGGPWTQLAIPQLASAPDPQIAITPNVIVVSQVGLFSGAGPGQLVDSIDGGQQWTQRPDPIWDGNQCTGASDLAAARTEGGCFAWAARPPAAAPKDCCARPTRAGAGRRSQI
jgi:hypothetical protein